MRIFVYEFVTAGGFWTLAEAGADGPADAPRPPDSLLAEGRAMLEAAVEEAAAVGGEHPLVLWDDRLGPPATSGPVLRIRSAEEHERLFSRLAAAADRTLLVAPEFDGILESLCRRAEVAGARLLSPGSEFVRLASDKNRTAEVLAAAGVPVPAAVPLEAALGRASDLYPLVLKPADGAGSLNVHRLDGPEDLRRVIERLRSEGHAVWPAGGSGSLERGWRLERWVPGVAASVAVLNGPRMRIGLPACRQIFPGDGSLRYLGGTTPVAADWDDRARSLAVAALAALPTAVGYVGVDLVLGADSSGGGDAVVEINPRLTTSYVGLRKSLSVNLIQAMMHVADGREVDLRWETRPVQFEADGTVNGAGS